VNGAAAAQILVTGGSGFLGQALVRRLRAEQRPVRLLVRRVPAWATVYHVGATTM